MDEYPAYRLTHDFSLLGDDPATARLVELPGFDDGFWLSPTEGSVPDTLYFHANLDVLRRTDFPIVNPSVPVLSKRVVDTLRSVGSVPRHRLIESVMLDDTVKLTFEDGRPRVSNVTDDRFVCMQLLEFTDAFDWERSIFTPHRRLPKRVLTIQALVLKSPPGGFPPLFRMSAAPSALLVSAEARRALEATGVQGCVFEPPGTISF